MSKTLVILCRGIGEQYGRGTLWNLTKYLPVEDYDIIDLKWKAEYGPIPRWNGDPFEKSLHEGESLLLSLCTGEHRDKRIVVVGYSGGAELAGNVLRTLAAGDQSRHGVVGGALLSDPSQPRGLPETGGRYGIRGSRDIGSDIPVQWFYEIKDVIAVCTPSPDSLLRVFADASSEFSLGGPRAWQGTIQRLLTKKLQAYVLPWWNLQKFLKQFNVAKYEAEGYLFRGDHTEYWKRRNSNGKLYFEDIADWIKSLD